jgi:hypothetical protein
MFNFNKRKIIMEKRLSEELNQILYLTNYKKGVVISEQALPQKYFSLIGNKLTIQNSKLYLYDKDGEMTPLNGVVSEFKVNPKTNEIVDGDFIKNQGIVSENFNNIVRSSLSPIQINAKFKFVGIDPKDNNVRVFTGDIAEMDITVLENDKSFKKSTDGLISPNTFVKKGKNGLFIRLYPGGKPLPLSA